MRRVVLTWFVVGAVLTCAPGLVSAQVAIGGVVKDSSGAVLPGATIEAASPALLEKSRTVVADSSGQYKIVDLSPGTYDVTFTLTGFKSVRRTGILLEGNFTAQLNAEMQVGNVEESITVSSDAPTIDVVNASATQTINRELLDAIPTGVQNTPGRALLLPGANVSFLVLGQYNVSVHGSATSDFTIAIDGLRVNNLCGSGQFSGFYMNDGSVQELNYSTGAESAEIQSSGMRVNSVPKEGGNRFSGSFYAQGVGSGLKYDNRSDELKKVPGFTTLPPGVAYDWLVNPSFGGPIAKDKLWFYFTYKYQKTKTNVPSTFKDGTPAYRELMGNYSAVTRIAWQASPKDKVRVYLERQANGEFFNGFATYTNVSAEAATDAWGGGWVPQVKWTRVQSSKLLLDAGLSHYGQPYWQRNNSLVGPNDLPQYEILTARVTGAGGFVTPTYTSSTDDYSAAASASYVTGSHAFKAGMTTLWGTNSRTNDARAQINRLQFQGGVPNSVVVGNWPSTATQKVNSDLGAYAQDSWTMRRLTLHVGGRYDHFYAEVPAESSAAGPWIQARDFAAIKDVPNWNDWAVRLGGAYDLFGTGKTAVKAFAGKYVASQAAGYAALFNGMSSSTQTRAWVDSNNDRTILNPDGSIQINEVIGGSSNFGQITDHPDPDLARGYNWEHSFVIEHEVVRNLRISGGYYHRKFYNLAITDNRNIDPVADWSPVTVTGPVDNRLPAGASAQTLTIYTFNPAKVGVATDNLRTFSQGTYGPKNTSIYNGVEFTFNARFRDKLIGFGGVTTEKKQDTTCDEPDNPNTARFCGAPRKFRTTVKASLAYQLPWDSQVSASYLGRPGPSVVATYSVNSALAGRTLCSTTTCTNVNVSINLIEPDTMFLDFQNTIDLRGSKAFKFGRYRASAFVDVFNALNSGTTMTVNTTYGSNPATNAWLRPLSIIQGAYLRFGTQWTF